MMEGVRERLRTELHRAIREREKTAVRALRVALAAIDNAEAIPLSNVENGSVAMQGDVPRRELSEAEVVEIVRAEVESRRQAIRTYEELGRGDVVEQLQEEVATLTEFTDFP